MSRTSPLLVAGLDLGSTHLKAARVELADDATRPVSVRALRRAATPDSAEDLVATALQLLDDVLEDGPVAALGIASMAETGVPLDAHGTPLTPLLRWDAGRPEPVLDLDPAELFARTGVRLAAKTPLATWAWLAGAHPDVRARMHRWAGVADLVAHALTRRLATDHTLAGRTGAYPLAGQGYDADLLGLVGLTPEALPEVTPPDEVAGRFVGVPVVVAGHDHQVGAHVCGVRSPGSTANSLGTAEALLRVLATEPDPEAVRAAGLSLVRIVDGSRLALLGGVGATGAAYADWCADPTGRSEAALLEELSERTRQMYDDQVALDQSRHGPVTLFGGPGARNRAWTRAKAGLLPGGVRVVAQEEPVAVGAAVVAAERAGLVEPGAFVLPAEEGAG